MPSPQLNLKTALWLLAVAAAALAGAEWNRRFQQPHVVRGPRMGGGTASLDTLKMSDGTTWFRVVYDGPLKERLTMRGDQGETITIAPPLPPE
jgi:hypothetical protein